MCRSVRVSGREIELDTAADGVGGQQVLDVDGPGRRRIVRELHANHRVGQRTTGNHCRLVGADLGLQIGEIETGRSHVEIDVVPI